MEVNWLNYSDVYSVAGIQQLTLTVNNKLIIN